MKPLRIRPRWAAVLLFLTVTPAPGADAPPFAVEETTRRITLRGEAIEASILEQGDVCFIHEVGERPVKAGESFGAAYAVGWFDSIEEMEKVYDQSRDHSALEVNADGWKLFP